MLIRLVNAAPFSEYYFKVAGHRFTVVGADANYITLYTLHHDAIAPGETYDAGAEPGFGYREGRGFYYPQKIYMVPLSNLDVSLKIIILMLA